MSTISEFVTSMLVEIGVARAGDVVNAEDMQLGLDTFNELLDFLNADSRAVYTTNFLPEFTLVPGLSPHTIGVAGSAAGSTDPTFVVANTRPAEILACQLNLGGNPAAYRNVIPRDDQWYAQRGVPGFSTAVPTDLYYTPDWSDPNATGLAYGAIFFYGIPSVAYTVRLWVRQTFAQVALGDTFSLPPGYKRALKMTGAEWIAGAFRQPFSQDQKNLAAAAREVVWGNNVSVPKMRSDVAVMPSSARGQAFNWRNRSFR